MERELVHGEGDLEGEPFRLAPHERRVLNKWFAYEPEATEYLHRRGLIGWGKGNGKTEFVGALALEHIEGPSWSFGTPVVTVAATDGDQAEELVRIAGMLLPESSELRSRFDVYDGRIARKKTFGTGTLLATSSAVGKNDGKRTSLLVGDELHEWDTQDTATALGKKRYGKLTRNVGKRTGSRQLFISTAGWSLDSILGSLYLLGKRLASGELVDPRFLFEWIEASPHWDLEDPEQLLQAVLEANPAADVFWPAQNLVESYESDKALGELPEWIRHHLNRWVPLHAGSWLQDMAIWLERGPEGPEVGPPPPAGTPVVLGFDGSESGDSTALWGATIEREPYWFHVGVWEHDGSRDWRVPVDEVEDTIVHACTRRGWDVKELTADVSYWRGSLERLAERGIPVVEFPQGRAHLGPACERAYEQITRAGMTHDGHPVLTRHIENCRRRDTEHGTRVVKEHKDSPRRIDAAIAAIQANDRALWWAANGGGRKPVYAY